MNYTANYGLGLPERTEKVSLDVLNENFRIIDAYLSGSGGGGGESGVEGVPLLVGTADNPTYLYNLERGVYVATGIFYIHPNSDVKINVAYKQLLLKGSTSATTGVRYAVVLDPVNLRYKEYKLKSDATYELTTMAVASHEKTANKVTVINENNTDTQYPSAKAVYEALQNISGVSGEAGATFFPSVSDDGIISWTNDKGLENPTPVNIKGEDGYTPVKGIDYFDGQNGKDGTVQAVPLFAESLEELEANGDTSKVYVLPDGFIYAYIETKVDGSPINLIDEVGYTNNTRISTSTLGSTKAETGYVTTGIIDISDLPVPVTIRTQGVDFSQSYSAITFFDANGTAKNANTISGLSATSVPSKEIDSSGNLVLVYSVVSDNYKKLQICGHGKGENLVVNIDGVNSESVSGYAWTNTGHAFVPADYEDRIIDLEADVAKLKEITLTADGAPIYVVAEAEEVADKVLSVRNANSFVFGAVSDLHTTGKDESAVGVMHAGMGMNEINNFTQLDMYAIFGDIIVNRFDNTNKNGFKFVKKSFAELTKSVPLIQMQGNHDELSSDTTEQGQQKYYAYIGANNVGTVTDYDNKFRNYGYRDFENYKIRVIYLNTADVSAGEVTADANVSTEQLNWLNTVALNLTDTDWGIIVLTHHPLNWYGMDALLNALDTYKGKNSGAELIAHFHGHLHNFRAETLGVNNIPTITIPNACFDRNNEYGTSSNYSEIEHTKYGDVDANGNQRQFNKTANSAEDTAFNVVVVDRQHRKIHCFNYGAGIDREINY